MRIWLAPSAYFPHRGGVEELTHQLARELESRGHQVLVVAPRHPADLPASERIEGVDVVRIRFRSPRMHVVALLRYPADVVAQLRELRVAWRRMRPDVVHVQCPSVQLPVITLLCWLTRVPLVVTSQGEVKMDAHRLYEVSTFMRLALRWSTRRAAALTACSAWTAEAAATIAPRFATARVVLNGVDPRQWQASPPVEAPVVCAWGRHVPQKGLDLLIDAFSDVVHEVPDAQLLIGGSGPETATLREMAGPQVSFVGALDRAGVHDLLTRSRIAVVPSRLEPFGIVALEAMATGRSVVWSTIGGLEDATRGRGRGVDPHDRGALAGAIVDLLRAPGSPDDVRAVAESSSWSHITDEYLDVYASVTRPRPGRGRLTTRSRRER